MTAKFINLDTIDKLDALIEKSFKHPVFLLKHSDTCGISADIFEQVGEIDGDVHLIVVQNARQVSTAIAERLGVRHASPQAFILQDGVPIYHATHYGIDPRKIVAGLLGIL